MALNSICDDVQKIAEAISKIIQIDVTIVDESLKRVAGTGLYYDKIGDELDKSSIFSHAFNIQKEIFISDPRQDEICITCSQREFCQEVAELCVPIMGNGQVIGVIGLIAFTEGQKEKLTKNLNQLVGFIKILSSLLVSKVEEVNQKEVLKCLLKNVEALVDLVGYDLISTDDKGYIKSLNSKSKKTFQINEDWVGRNISEVIDEININKIIARDGRIKRKSFSSTNCKVSGYYDVNPVCSDEGKINELIFTFIEIDEVIKYLHDITGSDVKMSFDQIIGDSEVFLNVKKKAERMSLTSSTILISGESGTGKEIFARAIHQNGSRSKKPFVAINCAAIPDDLLESELFGYESGAFTGAKKNGKIGKFELANKGTLFLDEIGEMKFHLQAKLLRALQESVIDRVGGSSAIPVDVRIIAATNRNLAEKVKDGEFREDLFYRLNVMPIELPPLRDREEDIISITDFIIEKFNKRLETGFTGVSYEAKKQLKSHCWPGNIRELENVIEYAMNMGNPPMIHQWDLPNSMTKQLHGRENTAECRKISSDKNDVKSIALIEKEEIIKALDLFGRDPEGICQCTEALQISRATLYRKIKKYDI